MVPTATGHISEISSGKGQCRGLAPQGASGSTWGLWEGEVGRGGPGTCHPGPRRLDVRSGPKAQAGVSSSRIWGSKGFDLRERLNGEGLRGPCPDCWFLPGYLFSGSLWQWPPWPSGSHLSSKCQMMDKMRVLTPLLTTSNGTYVNCWDSASFSVKWTHTEFSRTACECTS